MGPDAMLITLLVSVPVEDMLVYHSKCSNSRHIRIFAQSMFLSHFHKFCLIFGIYRSVFLFLQL